jgi:LysM repeat protein
MTMCSASIRGLGLALTVLLPAGCIPPPGSGDQTQAERYYDAGKSRMNRQDFSGALAAYEQALQADPHMAKAHFDLALLFDRDLNSPVKALYHYVRVLELDPAFPGADLVSNRLAAIKFQIASDSIPRVPSPLLDKEIDRLQAEVKALQEANQKLTLANNELNQRLVSAQQPQPQLQTPLRSVPQTLSAHPVRATDAVSENPTRPVEQSPVSSDDGRGVLRAEVNPVTRVPSASGQEHVIQPRQTLYGVSRQYGVTIDELIAANPGLSARNFPAGKTIKIPGK